MTDFSGIVVVDKHAGVTSNDIVNKLRRLYGTRQVGHTGTLDPMATGVLPVLVGRAVKASEFILAEDKAYTAELTLGYETDTEDSSGTVLSRSDFIPPEADVLAAIASFIGDSEQIPPMYSALKMGGKKLVDLAREGITVERPARPITISDIRAVRRTETSYQLDVHCSKGTYIRTLCADIGRKLHCGGVMSALRRTQSGPFTLAQSVTVAELEVMDTDARLARLLPLESYFIDCPAIRLPDFYARLCRDGCEIYQSKIHTDLPVGTLCRLYRSDTFFALGEVRDYPNGTAIKAVKIFVL